MFGFSDDEIKAIIIENPYLVYVIVNDFDNYHYLYACQTGDNISRICLKCGTYEEMCKCAEILCYDFNIKIISYDVK